LLAIQICLGYYCKRLNNSALLYFTYKFGNKIVSFLAETLFSFFSHFSLCFNEELQNLDYLSFIVSLTQWKKIEYIIHQVCFTFFFPIIYIYIYIYIYIFFFFFFLLYIYIYIYIYIYYCWFLFSNRLFKFHCITHSVEKELNI